MLEEESNLFKLKIDDKVLYDARSVASLSRRMAVIEDRTAPEGSYVSKEESAWRPKSGHFSASLGVDETYITKAVTPIFATSHVNKKLKLDK